MTRDRVSLVALLVLLFALFFDVRAWTAAAEVPGPAVTKVRVFPAPGRAELLKGTRVTGSVTSATNDFAELAKLADAPADDAWVDLPVDAKGEVYRFIKVETPPNSFGSVAEVEFYAGDRKLAGAGFGTQGSRDDNGNTFDKALDGDTRTFFEGKAHDNQYLGIDLGEAAQVKPVAVTPAAGAHAAAVAVELRTDTPGAEIRYTLDGREPDGEARVYAGPITIEESAVLVAVARKPGLARSVTLVAPFRIGAAAKGGAGSYATFHVGNSLTDTLDGWLKPVMESAGYTHAFYRFTIPGAPTDWLWAHPGQGFGESRYREAFLIRAPLTDVFTQPFEGHNRSVANEAEHSANFFAAAREHSPNVRPWLYSQWPVKSGTGAWADATWAQGEAPAGVKPAGGDYSAACENHLRYFEAVRERINKTWEGKPVLIVPTARAMAEAKRAVEGGKVPGLSDFDDFYSDDLHLSPKGRWFVANVVTASLTRESPEGKTSALNSGLTEAQARVLQRIAWEVVSNYEHAGVKK
ncbi:MAG: CBM62 [uncultured Phycisphaerae bacterium]|uniref:CBM62 n=1 Tax=uncultured Phycisphaerae bacterium TaxID=904963 RepID=A0A6J4QHI7_9BACT|nr:MAG: CBM62 [uncultured Phycisphaerae bacterium]